MKLVIDRSKWLRGCDGELLSDDGRMCCLGFLAKQCGADDGEILCMSTPDDVPEVNWPFGFLFEDDESGALRNAPVVDLVVELNDSKTLGDSEREPAIAAAFANHGIIVEFVDGVQS